MSSSHRFIEARDQLLRCREDWTGALRQFRWPALEEFNWVRDYFDVVAAGNGTPALRVVDDSGADQSLAFCELAQRSAQVASFFAAEGLRAGDRLLIMLPNCVPLWETMLAAIRLGAVMIPVNTQYKPRDLEYVLRDSDAWFLVIDESCLPSFAAMNSQSMSGMLESPAGMGKGERHQATRWPAR